MNRGKSNNFLRIKACIFDAYGTLFDFNAAVDLCSKDIGEKSEELSNISFYPISSIVTSGKNQKSFS